MPTKTLTLSNEATIRGILDGSVTVLVLPVEPQPPEGFNTVQPQTSDAVFAIYEGVPGASKAVYPVSPFGQPGDVVRIESNGKVSQRKKLLFTLAVYGRTKSVRCCRVGDVTEDEALKTGVRWHECYIPTEGFRGRPTCFLQSNWNATHGDTPGMEYEANPWVWVAEIERLEVDDETVSN